MNIFETIGKKVLSIYDCQCCGIVLNIIMAKNFEKISYFVISDDDNDIIYKLMPCDILGYDNEYITIKNCSKLIVTPTEEVNQNLKTEVIDIEGNSLGKIVDYILDDDYKITKITTQKGEITPKQIVTSSNNLIIFNNLEKPIKKTSFAPKQRAFTQLKANQIVSIQQPEQIQKIPVRINSMTTLLGKKLIHDIASQNGEIIARRNTIITIPLINTIKQYNLMTDLIQSIK